MIREDRIQLNNRFVEVFKLLQERGEIVLNDRGGKGMGDFAKKILGKRAYGHIIRAYLNTDDKRVIDYHQARAICREYGVNESYLIDGEGTPFGFDLPKANKQSNVSPSRGNILFTTVQAFAGSGAGMESASPSTDEDNEFFAIPGMSGNGLVAFSIEGNSMEPVINDGDIIICREIQSLHEIKDNEIYAVKSNGSLWVKYVKRIFNTRGRIVGLKLISANSLEFDPFEEEVNEYTRLYKVESRISSL
jgi:hypothetical protein